MRQTRAVITTILFAVLLMVGVVNADQPEEVVLDLHDFTADDFNAGAYNIVQDDKGYYWLAGYAGLQRWDGQSLETVFPGKQGFLPREHIKVMAASSTHLWLGTRGGLVSMNLDSYQTQFYINTWPGGLSHLNIHAISIDRFERVWVSTSDGLNLYQPETKDFIRFNVPNLPGKSEKTSSFDSVAAFDKDTVWVVSERQGLLSLDLRTGMFTPILEHLLQYNKKDEGYFKAGQKTTKLYRSAMGTMVYVVSKFFFEFDGYKLINQFPLPNVDPGKENYIASLAEDKFENIWIALKSRRLLKIPKDRSGAYRSMPLLNQGGEAPIPRKMGVDKQGQLVFGYNYAKAKIWNPLQQLVKRKRIPDLGTTTGLVRGEANEHGAWYCSRRSLFYYNKKTKKLNEFPFDSDKTITFLSPVEFEDGRVFVGGYQGLYELDVKTGKFTEHFTEKVFSLRHSEKWGLWFRDYYNFYHYDPLTKVKKTYKLPGFDATQSSKVYISDRYGPMFVFQNSLFHYLALEDKFVKTDFVNQSFMETESYLMTVGDDLYLTGRGLTRAKISVSDRRLSLQNIHRVKPFGESLINSPVLAKNGEIWFTDQRGRGIYRLNPKTGSTYKTTLFSGFPSGPLAAGLNLDVDGSLISLMSGEWWAFEEPDKYLISKGRKLLISVVKIIHQDHSARRVFDTGKTIKVGYRDLGIRFEFTDNLGGDADSSRIQLRLKGYDDNWLPAQSFDALYTSLEPGNYRFEVKTLDGQIESLEVEVLPAPWRTWWAHTIYAFLIALVIGLYIRQQRIVYEVSRYRKDQVRLYAQSFESSAEGFCVCNNSGKLLACNPAFQTLVGYRFDPKDNINLVKYIKREDSSTKLTEMQRALATGESWTGQLWLLSKNGRDIPINCKGRRVEQKSNSEELYMLVCSDISEQLQKEKELERLASVDPLTGLPNRRFLNDRIHRLINTNKRKKNQNIFSLLLINLDRFKSVNDSLGHDFGDEVLIQVGRRLKESLREIDTVARLSSDEFSVVLEDVENIEDIAKVCQKLLLRNEQPIVLLDREIHVSFSIGIAVFPGDGSDQPSLMNNADSAVNTVKQRGGNDFAFYTERMNEKSLNALKLESEIRQGLKKQEFIVHLQPKIDMLNGGIVGAEALVRWEKPQQGLIPPGFFIEAAEHSGLIIPMGLLVIREACKYLHHWRKMNYAEIPLAVNISAKQLLLDNFVDVVDAAVLEFGIKPSLLEFEITESTVMRDMDSAIKKLHQLRQRGHLISVDDFGTGYSSLSYISTLPIDVLKVDQSFVRDMLKDKNKFNIVKTIVELAKNLDLKTVAEGIETEEVHQALLKLGVDFGQGYLYGRPQGVETLEGSELFLNASVKSESSASLENQ